jgi:hypothetical protein
LFPRMQICEMVLARTPPWIGWTKAFLLKPSTMEFAQEVLLLKENERLKTFSLAIKMNNGDSLSTRLPSLPVLNNTPSVHERINS